MSARPSPIIRDILLFVAQQAVGFWGVFERPYSITYPLYKDVERALVKAAYDKPAITKSIRRLIQRNYLKVYEQDGNIFVTLTEKGEQRAKKYRIEEIGISRPKVWNGRWWVVIFDIPEKRKTNREAFRAALNRLGFKLLQKSVAIHPFPCREEIYAIAAMNRVLPYIRILEVVSVDPATDLLEVFAVKPPSQV